MSGRSTGMIWTSFCRVLRTVKARATGPVLIHVLTKKGKGYAPAEAARDRGHATGKFDVLTGVQAKAASNAPSYTKVFAQSLVAEAERDEKIVAVTAAMPDGTGLNLFAERFPKRCFDVGIAEQHAVTFSAGMAAGGLKPFCAIYSTFLQRGYDQVVHDVAIQRLPVRFAIDRAGLVGADGATHAGAFDVAFLANLPGFVVMAAADEAELVHMVATAAAHDEGPIAFRFPRGDGVGVEMPARGVPLEIGRGAGHARRVAGGDPVALARGWPRCWRRPRRWRRGAFGRPWRMRGLPSRWTETLILRLAREHEALITIEEGAVGGFGSHVAQLLAEEGRVRPGAEVPVDGAARHLHRPGQPGGDVPGRRDECGADRGEGAGGAGRGGGGAAGLSVALCDAQSLRPHADSRLC